MKLKSEVILVENTTQERLERRLTETIKEIRKMSKSNRRNIFDFLFEAEDEKKKVEELEEAEAKPEPIVQDQPKGGLDKIVIKGQINSEKDLKALKNLMRDMKRKGWSSSGSWGSTRPSARPR